MPCEWAVGSLQSTQSIRCPIIWLDIYRLKAFRELVLHHPICETQRVSGASNSGHIAPETICHLDLLLLPSSVISV